MAIADLILSTDAPQSAFLWAGADKETLLALSKTAQTNEFLYFQYWPQSLQDDYQVEYAEHSIPGGSHPLYQWVGGQGRTITFQAIFTSEIDETRYRLGGGNVVAGGALNALGQSALTPSSIYTVDVDAALSRLRGWMLPKYNSEAKIGEANPPPILYLALRGTQLAGSGSGGEVIRVILRSAPITYEAWFPNGRPRIATVDLTLSEIVQYSGATPSVQFIDRRNFENTKYNFRGVGDRPAVHGSI